MHDTSSPEGRRAGAKRGHLADTQGSLGRTHRDRPAVVNELMSGRSLPRGKGTGQTWQQFRDYITSLEHDLACARASGIEAMRRAEGAEHEKELAVEHAFIRGLAIAAAHAAREKEGTLALEMLTRNGIEWADLCEADVPEYDLRHIARHVGRNGMEALGFEVGVRAREAGGSNDS